MLLSKYLNTQYVYLGCYRNSTLAEKLSLKNVRVQRGSGVLRDVSEKLDPLTASQKSHLCVKSGCVVLNDGTLSSEVKEMFMLKR